jgi:choline dehydrogenase-like flavoprotein
LAGFHMQAERAVRVVVIGSGPGGAITAALLAEAGVEVALLENGPNLPLDSCPPFSLAEMTQKYRNGGLTPALGRQKIAYVEGCCVGGGSEINSGLYHPTPPAVLEHWRTQYQLADASEREMQQHFSACEQDLSVSLIPAPDPATAGEKLRKGAAVLGWKALEVPRWFKYSESPLQPQHFRAERQSMTKTFIPRFLSAGGTLFPQTRALKIHQESGRWTVRALTHDGQETKFMSEFLFLCCGATQTPALLRRSGITKNIGNTLQLHPTVKVTARFPDAVNSSENGVPPQQVKQFAPRLSFGCSISSLPYLALSLIDAPVRAEELPELYSRMAIYYAMISTSTSGCVRPLPGFRDPLVRYNLRQEDLRQLADGLRKLCELLLAAGAETIYPSLAEGPIIQSADDLHKIPAALDPARSNLMTIHLFSSCPMGENNNVCAAGSFGRVHGVSNLYINDASLLCSAPGVNPQGSVMAFARRNTLHFLSNFRK